jgi:hypothetical protein
MTEQRRTDGYDRDRSPNPGWREQGLCCEYEHCIETMGFDGASCYVFGHDCPGGKTRVIECEAHDALLVWNNVARRMGKDKPCEGYVAPYRVKTDDDEWVYGTCERCCETKKLDTLAVEHGEYEGKYLCYECAEDEDPTCALCSDGILPEDLVDDDDLGRCHKSCLEAWEKEQQEKSA